MIIHKNKCVFVHIPKTAGTSICSFFKVMVHINTPTITKHMRQ